MSCVQCTDIYTSIEQDCATCFLRYLNEEQRNYSNCHVYMYQAIHYGASNIYTALRKYTTDVSMLFHSLCELCERLIFPGRYRSNVYLLLVQILREPEIQQEALRVQETRHMIRWPDLRLFYNELSIQFQRQDYLFWWDTYTLNPLPKCLCLLNYPISTLQSELVQFLLGYLDLRSNKLLDDLNSFCFTYEPALEICFNLFPLDELIALIQRKKEQDPDSVRTALLLLRKKCKGLLPLPDDMIFSIFNLHHGKSIERDLV